MYQEHLHEKIDLPALATLPTTVALSVVYMLYKHTLTITLLSYGIRLQHPPKKIR